MTTSDVDDEAFKQAALLDAIDGLRNADPLRSATTPLIGWQKAVLWSAMAVTAAMAVWQPQVTAMAFIAVCTVFYVWTLLDRLVIFRRGLASGAIRISDERARGLPDDDLPGTRCWCPPTTNPRSSET